MEIFVVGKCETGKELRDPRVLTSVGDLPVQEIRDCGVDDERLMSVITESVKLVMEEVHISIIIVSFSLFFFCMLEFGLTLDVYILGAVASVSPWR